MSQLTRHMTSDPTSHKIT